MIGMLLILLTIAFSSVLEFEGLTLSQLASWANEHPFWTIFIIYELIHPTTLGSTKD